MKSLYIILLASGMTAICWSCKEGGKKTVDSGLHHPLSVDSSYYFDQLDLEETKYISDSFYLRFWLTYSGLVDSGKIINIYYRKNLWRAEFISYRFLQYSEDDLKQTLVTRVYKTGSPKTDWKVFINNMQKTAVLSLNRIINRKDLGIGLCTDANILSIEVVSREKFKQIFKCWEGIENKEEVNKVTLALSLIEKEFGFPISPFY